MTLKENLISNSIALGLSLGFNCTDRYKQAQKLKDFQLLIVAIGKYQRSKHGEQDFPKNAIENIVGKLELHADFDKDTRSVFIEASVPIGLEPILKFDSDIPNDDLPTMGN